MLKKQFMFNHGESGINRFSVLGRDLINTILAYVSADYYKMAEEKEQADKEKALEGSRGVQYRVIV